MSNPFTQIQKAIYDVISASEVVMTLTSGQIMDVSTGDLGLTGCYVIIGTDHYKDRSSKTHECMEVSIDIRVYSSLSGLKPLKDLSFEVVNCITRKPLLELEFDHLVYLQFNNSKLYRLEGGKLNVMRLQFVALVEKRLN